MERDLLAAVFYGEGRAPPPFATDCPIRFDTWLAFSQPSPEGLTRRVDVILAVNEEHGVRRVLDHFANLGLLVAISPIAAGGFVAARLSLDDLVRAVLPMTNLFGIVRLAQSTKPDELIEAAMEGSSGALPSAPNTDDGVERMDERRRHLSWLLRLLVAVASSAEAPRGPPSIILPPPPADLKRAAHQVVEMLRGAMAERTITQLPPAPGNQVIDRRRRYPIVSVTTNRVAGPAVSRSRQTVKADAAETVFAVDCRSIGWAVVDSGIDAEHAAFAEWDTSVTPPSQWFGPSRVVRAFDFIGARGTLVADRTDNGLIDWARALAYLELAVPRAPPVGFTVPPQPYKKPVNPHGTHVAGVLGGFWPERGLRGMCPNIRLYDFRVLDDQGQGDEFAIVMALQAIRHINEQSGRLTIAGVNLSLSVPHDVATHSCGWTPVCIECDRLVRTGVVVVTSAGNSGFTGGIRTLGSDYHTVSISIRATRTASSPSARRIEAILTATV